MRILVVDDDLIAAEMMAEMLRERGHQVTMAADGVAALAVMRAEPFPLVISDLSMPRMDGNALCEAIRSSAWGSYVYFIMLTSREERSVSLDSFAAGADDFMCKPFDPEEVIARLRVAERILLLETQDVTIFALAKLAESRDPETGKHLERVQGYCRVLAQKMMSMGNWPEVDASFVNLIYKTSALHDIGKVGIPDAILLKPGRLSPTEFEVMKTHTDLGAETLALAAQQRPGVGFLEMSRQIAMSHHEKWDGSGYPEGLSGRDIPLAARIVAIADVYDALTSRRLYKEAFSHDRSCGIIFEGAGNHFDPELVEVFRAVADEFAEIRATHRDLMAIAA
jgi:putative two-component system response regulator